MLVLDLCSGFGYLAMFLSEMLPPHKVDRIVCVDIAFAPHNVPRQPHHLNPEHLYDEGWPVRITTSRCDLKSASDRRGLVRTFLAGGSGSDAHLSTPSGSEADPSSGSGAVVSRRPAILLGVHLCGTLSLRAAELFTLTPCVRFLALKPCCLPPLIFSQRAESFRIGEHTFLAASVCADVGWKRGRWVGRSSREEVERKFGMWASHLARGVQGVESGTVTLEKHIVQRLWFQNMFIFASKPLGVAMPPPLPAPPEAAGTRSAAEVRAELIERREQQRRDAKKERRRHRWTEEQREEADQKELIATAAALRMQALQRGRNGRALAAQMRDSLSMSSHN